jgi:GTP-binding protein HflX
MDQLKKMMADTIAGIQADVELYFTKSEEYKIFDLSREGRIVRKEAATEGTVCVAQLTPSQLSKWRNHLVK